MASIKRNQDEQDDDPIHCARPGCHCEVQPGEKYCCESCEKDLEGGPCICGHPDCQLVEEELP